MKEALIAFVIALFIGAAINSFPGGLFGAGGLFGPPAPNPVVNQTQPGQDSSPGSAQGSNSTTAPAAAAEASSMPAVSDATFASDVLAAKDPVLVDCFATWCEPCKQQTPILEKLAGQYGNKVKFLRLDVDQNSQTSSQYNVTSLPTILIFKGGKRVDSYTGLMPEQDLVQALNKQL
jgi:thioredoxin 1